MTAIAGDGAGDDSAVPDDRDATADVRWARDAYFARNGFSAAAYTAPMFRTRVGPLWLRFRNPGFLHLHDLHHVVTGYRTDLVGEGEISAFELRGGCPSRLVAFLCVGAILFASLLAPGRVFRAFRRARGARTLYVTDIAYGDLLRLTVGELRARLCIPASSFVAD